MKVGKNLNQINRKMKVAILGTGNIGCDILAKINASPFLECSMFAGRNNLSNGIKFAKSLSIRSSTNGVSSILENLNNIDLVFDATSASSHLEHVSLLKDSNIKIINLTPAECGIKCIPSINITNFDNVKHISMISCGGQASIPLAFAVQQVHRDINYIEVVSSISAKSAGLATRHNLDEYLNITEKAIVEFTGCQHTKAIININPAEPCIDMQTTVYINVSNPNIEQIQKSVTDIVIKIKEYAPKYQLINLPFIDNGKIVIMVKVKGMGYYLPEYAGNLDIITNAAIKVAEYNASLRFS